MQAKGVPARLSEDKEKRIGKIELPDPPGPHREELCKDMRHSSLSGEEVKERETTATLIGKWERTLAEGGLHQELDPIIPEEVQELFPMDCENVADDFEPVGVSDTADARPDAAPERIVLTVVERRIVERIKDLGWAATLTEANATDEQIARLADSGTAFLRAADSGETVLAMANATNADVRRAAARIEKPRVEKFIPKANRPATPAVMFLEHHNDEKVQGEEAKAKAANEFRHARRVAVARRIIEAHGGRLTKEAKTEMAQRLFGETINRAREGGPELGEGLRGEVKRSLARAASEALSRTRGRQGSRRSGWRDDPEARDRFARRVESLSGGGWTSESALRRSIEEQRRSGRARLNTARAIYAASLGRATHRILHVLRRDGRTALAELRRRFHTDPEGLGEALAKLAGAGHVRKLRSRRTGEVFIEAKGAMDEARYEQALRRILASGKCGLRSGGGGPGRRAAA